MRRTRTKPARITEIDGLRGVSLTLVVVFHLFGHGRVSGGVDVFLMISGFLLTLTLARSLGAGRPLGVVARWARTFIRLTPPAAVVLIAVVVLSFLVYEPWAQLGTLREVIATALYYENWHLISEQLTYDAAGSETSALQHFWSLSVQAQFFVVLPLVAVIVTLMSRRAATRVRIFWVAVIAGTICSFVYAWQLNAVDPTRAYFDSFARAWELGLGGIVAGLWKRGIVIPAAVRGIAGWIGLAMIVSSGFLFEGKESYPGPYALLPVLGAAIVLLSAGATHPASASRVLSHRSLVQLDRISYGLYLWHWPILIAYLTYRGDSDGVIGPLGAIGVLAAAYAATMLTTWLLRLPTRWAANRGVVVQLIAVGVAIAIAVAPAATSHASIVRSADIPLESCSGAAALDPDRPECRDFTAHASRMPPTGILPVEALRRTDDATRADCWSDMGDDSFDMCTLGDSDSDLRILALGDSHLAVMTDALEDIAEDQGWRIDMAARGWCRWMGEDAQLADIDQVLRDRCVSWREEADEVVEEGGYDAIFVAAASHSTFDVPEGVGQAEFETQKLLEAWSKRPDAENVPIIALHDNPRIFSSVQEPCFGNARALNDGDCSVPRDEAIADMTGLDDALARDPNAVTIDVNDYICAPDRCNPVVGGVAVYRDNAHMTATFIETLRPYIERELVDALR
ncbi:acyltransferase family protein [Microbacterium sp.]|uniref:acyltransferase family protein n=2 Tax=Microbacterium TaxID=33882 RepID=UPI003F9E9E67